jgi:mono/diheme cytochrome c family protein
MNPRLARLSLLVFGVLLPVTLIVIWSVTPAPAPPLPPPKVAPLPQHLLPQVPLPTGSDPESAVLRRSILNGERIYQRLCYNCHGRQGKGDNNEYMASIGHQPADHTDLRKMQQLNDWEFFVALRDGVKDERGWLTMPPWESVLSAAEMWDVIAYVRRLPLAEPPGRQPAAPVPVAPLSVRP